MPLFSYPGDSNGDTTLTHPETRLDPGKATDVQRLRDVLRLREVMRCLCFCTCPLAKVICTWPTKHHSAGDTYQQGNPTKSLFVVGEKAIPQTRNIVATMFAGC